MRNNIFIRQYKVAENRLTESFMKFLSCLEYPTLNKILSNFGVRSFRNGPIEFEMQPRGKKSIPDATISSEDKFAIYIEVKKVYKTISFRQLKHHAEFLINNPAKYKLLLIIAPDCTEPIKIKKQWSRLPKHHLINKRFISWSEIWRFIHRIKEMNNIKDKFLLNQFADYLKEEGVINMTQAFRKEDAKRWNGFAVWVENIENFMRKEIRDYIESSYPNWVLKGFSSKTSDISLHFRTSKSNKYFHFYLGFSSGVKNDERWEESCFYVGWKLRRKHFKKVLNSRGFKNKERLLNKKGFFHWKPEGRQSFYNVLKIEDIAKKEMVESQVQYIKNFIDTSIKIFNKVGLVNLL